MDRTRKHHEEEADAQADEQALKAAVSAEPGADQWGTDTLAEARRVEDLKECRTDERAANEEVRKLTEELESLKDIMRRRQADFENYKKRQAKLQQDQKRHAIKDLALDILHINDDLIRAVEAGKKDPAGESNGSLVEGVGMISRRIEDTLKKYGIVEIDALDLPFDPTVHEAVEIETSADIETDMVTKVYQKGFHIDDIVLRNARVRVAKAVKPSVDQAGKDAGAMNGDDAEKQDAESNGTA